MADVLEDVCRNPEMAANLEKMLDNKRYSDTIFLVNKKMFYASSHIVSISSVEMESILESHYENRGDREIRIRDVKYDESFPVILRFLYGLDIVLPQLNKAVLCEVLTLAERFEMKVFGSKLKNYLSKYDNFQVDFLAVLLNTAKKFQMIDLYKKLTIYAFENAHQLLHHACFAELQYDVLLDLVKANFFCTNEVDILKGIVFWHGKYMSSSNNSVTANVIQAGSIELKEEKILHGACKKGANNENLGDKNKSSFKTKEICSIYCENHKMKEFSQSILKSLLSHVRISKIPASEINKFIETEVCTSYKDFISDLNNFSTISEPRVKYNNVEVMEKVINNVSKKFTVLCPKQDAYYESNEDHILGDLKWKIILKETLTKYYYYTVDMWFKCSLSDATLQKAEWDYSAEVQIKMLPTGNSPTLYIPGINTNILVKATPKQACAEIGNFFYNNANNSSYASSDHRSGYKRMYTFEVTFKNIRSKVTKLKV